MTPEYRSVPNSIWPVYALKLRSVLQPLKNIVMPLTGQLNSVPSSPKVKKKNTQETGKAKANITKDLTPVEHPSPL